MSDDEPLLEVAAALADGTDVDWESAARSAPGDDHRRLLAELRFIADIIRGPQAEPAALRAGQFWGPLKILEPIGHGTFGDVYRAWDSRLDREVALKILRRAPEDATRESTIIQEGRLLARVRHPNIATVHGAERIDGQVGIWMEYVHGKTLEQQLREQGPFDPQRVIAIGVALANALSSVHRAGWLHRDVKAQNVLSDRDGRVVLTDFGAGCEVMQTSDAGTTGGAAGTPITVAPEVLEGRPATPHGEVYSLGVLLYHLLTATYPVCGRSLKEIREGHEQGRRTSLSAARPDLSDSLGPVVDRAIDPNPGLRYDGPEAFGAALAALVQPPVAPASARRGRRAAVVALAAVLGSVLMWLAGWPERLVRMTGATATVVPVNPEIELVEVVTLTEQGRIEDAYERGRRVLSADPKSAAAGNAVAYALTYAGFLDEAMQAIEGVLASNPEYLEQNRWWTPTALLYARRHDRFLDVLRPFDSSSARLYGALAEVERGRRESALAHLVGLEVSPTTVFNGLALGLHAHLAGRQDEAGTIVRSVADRRRAGADRDGEITFKQAQILSLAGLAPEALAMLDEAVAQGFVCVTCAEGSTALAPVRALPGYGSVRARALARQTAFGRRFGLSHLRLLDRSRGG